VSPKKSPAEAYTAHVERLLKAIKLSWEAYSALELGAGEAIRLLAKGRGKDEVATALTTAVAKGSRLRERYVRMMTRIPKG